MQEYPSIPGWRDAPQGRACIGFDKLDGSNLRWEWNRKSGWSKFGTRTRLFGADEDPFREAVPLFLERFSDEIISRLGRKYREAQRITAFTEFFGPGSFAGNHVPEAPKELVLLDLHIHREGFLLPQEFVKIFGGMDHVAEVVYEGNFNRQLIEAVRNGEFGLNEGMVCKGTESRRRWVAKVKTIDYLERLKGTFGDSWEQYADGQ